MRFFSGLMLIAAALSTGAALANSPPVVGGPMIVGGWSPIKPDAASRKAAAYALKQLKRGKARIASVDSVERQVVAGTNYQITMRLTDGSRWAVTVWHRLDGRYRMTASKRLTALAAQSRLTVTGRVTYRERMALPEGSVVTIAIDDIARMDANAVRLSSQRIVTKGQQVPIAFALVVDRARLPGPIGNTVSVRIESPQGELLWITDTINSVEPDERSDRVDMGDIVLVRAQR